METAGRALPALAANWYNHHCNCSCAKGTGLSMILAHKFHLLLNVRNIMKVFNKFQYSMRVKLFSAARMPRCQDAKLQDSHCSKTMATLPTKTSVSHMTLLAGAHRLGSPAPPCWTLHDAPSYTSLCLCFRIGFGLGLRLNSIPMTLSRCMIVPLFFSPISRKQPFLNRQSDVIINQRCKQCSAVVAGRESSGQ